MTKAAQDPFRWARRVSRHKVRRLYESDAQGALDHDLLNEVGYGMYARCRDMFQVWEARQGRVTCRACGAIIVRRAVRGWHLERKREVLRCGQCDWQVTWGDYYESYTGNRMLPGSAEQVIRDFVERWPKAHTPSAKMIMIDTLIHEFHINQGIEGRPTGENVIAGSKKQVCDLIESLAYGTNSTKGLQDKRAWLARLNDPIRRFRQSHSLAAIHAIARELGIKGSRRMREEELVATILHKAPERFDTS
jgi:hypothetical protein